MRTLMLFLLLCIYQSATAQQPLYKDSTAPVEKRVADLLSRMTPEEKFWQLFMIPGDLDNATPGQYKNGIFGFQVSAAGKGDAGGQLLSYNTSENALLLTQKINSIQRYFVAQTRLGIPIIAFDEALHGLVRDGATAFPQSVALAATWDTALMHKVAMAIAVETKARGIRDILTPVVNIASDVRWGRTEETYGEDPFLTSEMGVAFVSAFEKMNIITTPKHFVANVGDGGRDSYPVHWNERLLDEIYFAPFKACIERGGSRSVMSAYNSLDGIAASSNKWLLTEKLKNEWGFKGFVISDANAVGGEVVLHNTAKDYAEAGLHAINGGLDVIFQTEYKHHTLFIDPFVNGGIDAKRIDDAVSRVLRAKFELGLFEHSYVAEETVKTLMKEKPHKALAKQAALESAVLLKNEKQILPLQKSIKTIAVIGEDAAAARLGGYSGNGNGKVSILDGIKAIAKNSTILYAPGAGVENHDYNVISKKYLSHAKQPGLQAAYFNNITFSGEPAVKRIDEQINFSWTLFPPDPKLDVDFYAARWTGQLTAPATGTFKIGLEGNDGYRLYINDKMLIDNWQKQTYTTKLADLSMEQGKLYNLRVEFYEPKGNAQIKLVWNADLKNDWKTKIQTAVNTAKQADVAIIAAGIHEGEFQDRAMLSLPGHQEELINAVAATGKPVVVVLVGGSAITMNNWLQNVNSVLDVWYPGEEGGHAVAAILFGDYNPAGRLPVTFPVSEAQLPLVYNHKPTGRGDDYYNLSGEPLFPFGFGLSYTSFGYSNMRLSKNNIGSKDSITVTCTIENTGKTPGDEVVQLYIRDLLASVARPVMELKGFRRMTLKPGETKEVSFLITPAMLSMLNKNMETVVEPGDFRIMIGASSHDLRLKQTLTVQD
ncbi:glycoside hydrolase family 3 C-terminal domain-containing protein [Panacibacter sp. DH6]|uniref:Glycoside hydrolase family 3 C-terminal domain-containing protein n=1 Tax=Panacibacter microcysteis TaxID=2793269 RepID=A0A931E369_9BACT|nr:glycoside hydrolase family 3 C-terminal domain-containing protein [Panacibacter microcysteis]MBG9377752.1 glycoside hydrolase family 3 C-terminal domain-containing protein [Panacibacter microcysteis]